MPTFGAQHSGCAALSVLEVSGDVNFRDGWFLLKWIGDKMLLLHGAVACVHHGYDECMDLLDKDGVMFVSVSVPLSDVYAG